MAYSQQYVNKYTSVWITSKFTLGTTKQYNRYNIRGAPIRIFEADHRKQYLSIRSPIPIFLKPSFYHVELFIVILQSVFLDIYSVPEFHFWKWGGIPLLGDSCERGLFNLRGVFFFFFYIFQNIYFSHLNVWSSSAFLFLQLCNGCRNAYTQHKPDFTQESTTDPSVYHKHNIYPLFWFQIQTLLLKMLFHCDSFSFLFLQ